MTETNMRLNLTGLRMVRPLLLLLLVTAALHVSATSVAAIIPLYTITNSAPSGSVSVLSVNNLEVFL